jgi:predicted neutral ceramidase superfamily lipid hydrolase
MDTEEEELSSESYLATVSIIAVIIAAIGIVLLPIAPILSIFALTTAIFTKRSSEPGSKSRRTANIVIVLATLLLVAEMALISAFLVKTYWPSLPDQNIHR